MPPNWSLRAAEFILGRYTFCSFPKSYLKIGSFTLTAGSSGTRGFGTSMSKL
jgi:hypothetical protein